MKFKTILLLLAGIIFVNHFKKKGTGKKTKKTLLSGLVDEVKKPLSETASNVPEPSLPGFSY